MAGGTIGGAFAGKLGVGVGDAGGDGNTVAAGEGSAAIGWGKIVVKIATPIAVACMVSPSSIGTRTKDCRCYSVAAALPVLLAAHFLAIPHSAMGSSSSLAAGKNEAVATIDC
jgi:hypothetical protein